MNEKNKKLSEELILEEMKESLVKITQKSPDRVVEFDTLEGHHYKVRITLLEKRQNQKEDRVLTKTKPYPLRGSMRLKGDLEEGMEEIVRLFEESLNQTAKML